MLEGGVIEQGGRKGKEGIGTPIGKKRLGGGWRDKGRKQRKGARRVEVYRASSRDPKTFSPE